MLCGMPTCGAEHTDLEMTVRGAEYLDPSTPALDGVKSLVQRSPEHALWLGVMELAVREIMTSEHAKLVRNATRWVAQPSRDVGDFLWITDNLQMQSDQVQERLVKIGKRRLHELLMRKRESLRAKLRSS